jgi:hypothetical protein
VRRLLLNNTWPSCIVGVRSMQVSSLWFLARPFIDPRCRLRLPAVLTGVQRRRLPHKSSLLSRPLGIRWWMHSGRCTVGHTASARLDRVLLSGDSIPLNHQCWFEAGSGNHSDRPPLLCSLLPRFVPGSLQTLWCAPTAVLEPADLMECLTVWIKHTVELHLPLHARGAGCALARSQGWVPASDLLPSPNIASSPAVLTH